MASLLQEVCDDVLKKTTPTPTKQKKVLALAKKLLKKVITVAKKIGIDSDVRIEGSVAKGTWLSEEPDIDIFMRLPLTMPRKSFGTICLEIAREATKGFRQIERFAEHPYLEAIVNEVCVNIVPCYQVELGNWISATDRTPFHTDYMKPLLNERLCAEIRLLKRFMKGIGVYGAEIRVGGFSGYLCELLILNYRSFVKVLKSVANWKGRIIIDYEGHYDGREVELAKVFGGPLIIVDPVDKGRNAAAAVQKERLYDFVVAARAFLKKPRERFFYPLEIEAFNARKLINSIETRGSSIVFVTFGRIEAVPDVLWGQLFKSQRSLRKMLQEHDFRIIRDSVWSNEETLNIFIFEIEKRKLPLIRKHFGPPIGKKEECEKFLLKHLEAAGTISGPRVEEGRWVAEIERKHTDAVDLLLSKLRDGGRHIGVAEGISRNIANSEILVNDEILRLYSTNSQFAVFLTKYLIGKPSWLT